MRLSHTLIFASAVFIAAPALSQDNTIATDNTLAVNAVDANAAVPMTSLNETTTPGTADALPPDAATPVDTGATTPVPAKRGIPWGVVGLLGLLGLFGVRKAKG